MHGGKMFLVRKSLKKVLLVLTCVVSAFASAEIYKWVDEKGKTHFGERKPENHHEQVIIMKDTNISKPTTIKKRQLQSYAKKHQHDKNVSNQPQNTLSERECFLEYGLSCYEVYNWKALAFIKCTEKKYADCDRDEFLENRYKPRTRHERADARESARLAKERKLFRNRRY
jgi:Domain of unknown function (DUF4124)